MAIPRVLIIVKGLPITVTKITEANAKIIIAEVLVI
jgi:hypothetical protein